MDKPKTIPQWNAYFNSREGMDKYRSPNGAYNWEGYFFEPWMWWFGYYRGTCKFGIMLGMECEVHVGPLWAGISFR